MSSSSLNYCTICSFHFRQPRLSRPEKNRDASVPIVGTTGSTPLHFAAANGNKNVISTLLLRGAHPDRRDKYGISPAMLAEQGGWLECAQLLNNWVKDKDRDLRERKQPNDAGPSYVAHALSGNEDDIKPSTRKHIQVKRSIDTALNMFKSGSVTPQSKLTINSSLPSANNLAIYPSATSPTRQRRDFSPSPSEDGRFSPSPSPIDPGSRRPSLPHILHPPSTSTQRSKPSTLMKSPRNPRRPRSAGTDAEPDPNSSGVVLGQGSAGRKLGTKYSLLNLFKKGSEVGGAPLERTISHQSSMSMNSPSHNSSFKALSNSPRQTASPLSENIALPSAGYRFGGSSKDTPLKARTTSSSSHTRTSPSTSSIPRHQTYTPPPRPPVPFAVDLHNAITAHMPLPNRDRSGSSGSATRYESPMGLGITFDEAEGERFAATAPLNKLQTRRFLPSDTGHSRDRSGSNASNRNGTIFDDEVIISAEGNDSSGNVSISESVSGASKNYSRPSILRGHDRTYSSGQPRALRFDSSTSVLTGTSARRESDAQPPKSVAIPLRGCISAGSLNRLRNERSPRLRPMALDGGEPQWQVPESAPPNIGDFEMAPAEESEYGHPLQLSSRLDTQMRNRGLSFTSSESSLSPAMDVSSTLNAEFPFSINAPPLPLDDSEPAAPVHFQVSPPPISPVVDTRLRGDSVSSTSTADSGLNPSLSTSATTSGSGGSGAIPTPMVSPEGSSYLNLPSTDFSRSRNPRAEKVSVPDVMKDDYRDGLDPGPAQGVTVVGLNERRSHAALESIDVELISSHAQAEALVQRTQQDILSAHSGGVNSSASDVMPLSARLAALGESLELERRLREQKKAEDALIMKATESAEDASSTSRTEILRQSSLDQLSRSVSSGQNIRRPHANSEASRMNSKPDLTLSVSWTLIIFLASAVIPVFERSPKLIHHPSLSTSAVEVASPVFDSDAESPAIQTKFFDRHATRSRTPDPDNDLSRISSLEVMDADTELGPSLFRVSTAPNTTYTARDKRERELASNTKLTRMGFSPNEIGRTPPKRFGGLKSLMQSLKGGK